MNVIKVSANSRTAAVAGAIAGVMREHRYAEVQSIGAGAVNQAIKATILAKGYLVNDGIDIICVPEFVDVDIDGKVRTAIKLTITPRGEDTAPAAEMSMEDEAEEEPAPMDEPEELGEAMETPE
ncbi:stage V sporulation protein S [bacterium]|nr:stage V sporulation protein S [bacterium]